MRRICATEDETKALGAEIGRRCRGGEIVLLNGDLGAGKTTLAKGIALGLGIKAEILSPAFTLVKTYVGGRLDLHHFDLYRIEDPSELENIGAEEYFDLGGVCVIEWNKLSEFPRKAATVELENIDGRTRAITVEGI